MTACRGAPAGCSCGAIWMAARLKYYLSNAPADTALLRLAQVGAMRWPVETEFQTEKGETGLDEYEVRTWLGWHHHITMALLAGAFLLSLQRDWGKKYAPDHSTATHARLAGTATTAPVDANGTLGLAVHHPAPQRAGQTGPCGPAACQPDHCGRATLLHLVHPSL